MSDPIREQYATSEKFRARVSLHKRFRVGDLTWPRWVFDRMSIPAAAKVLELGCGTGLFWRVNGDRVAPTWRLFLTDYSEGMARESRAAAVDLLSSVYVASIDAQSIPFADGTFDVVIAGHMLYHVPDRERAIREVRRVLAPNGVFHASTIGRRYLWQVWELFASAAPEAPNLFEYAHAAFGEETGPELLRRSFEHVETDVFEERLRITEAEPVADYLRSIPAGNMFTAEHLKALTAAVREEIEAKGALEVEAPAVLFTCRA
jgi:ubiquinone/menaquinone biosynthesis C-methylase UbiE